jgi:hypothetical protein
LDYARELGQPILQLIGNAMALRSGGAAPAMPGGTPAAPAALHAFNPYSDQMAMREHSRRMNAQAAAAPLPPQPSSAPPANGQQSPLNGADGLPGANEILPLLAQFGGLVVNALNGNVAGHYFARNVSELVGVGTHAMIARHGEDVLAASMMSFPEMSMFGEARLRKFAFEFVHYEELLANEEEGDGPELELKRDEVTA